ncbi:heavy metal translocating P-type ATPase [Methanolacinia petrolearia DSM 11571]|uniref:Heavy metal translocating P-type ATPase n=1 Tax=Methanolacinia petrolearia (strain DSM 11571 / OCM 486 / SEBR 4847) TaxID=679926 RepID=E1RFB6_METP4|nr:heavy metal translocating P-type ATPase [Methanolacinia petrolearia]ADN35064.1 heavy metal translocating P-type ATPase [Methanolacinia petrolearia DSM 11571]
MSEKPVKKTSLKVTGMHCAACAANVESALKKLEGVDSASVSIASEDAQVSFDPEKISLGDIESTIKKSGYGVSLAEQKIKIGGMHCAVCAGSVKTALEKVNGVMSADVNLVDNSAVISYIPGDTDKREFKTAVESAGFQYMGTEEDFSSEKEEEEFEKEQKNKLVRIVLGLGTAAVLIAIMYSGLSAFIPVNLLMFIISTPVLIYLAYPIFSATFISLRNRTLSMDVMYALGIGTAYIASVFGTFGIVLTSDFMFYETAVMLTAFLTLGRYLEANAKGRTNDAVKKLLNLKPAKALVKKDGEYVEIPAEDLMEGAEILVKPGGRVPVDGTVLSGEAYVDESMITGEPVPVLKKQGDTVTGGTLLTGGSVAFTATKVGKDTVLSQIISLVEETQRTKPPVQRIADVAVAWFIPVILLIAIVASSIWYFLLGSTTLFALTVFISIIVVACPCALGLATPTAVTVGIGRGAELGILIRNGEALEISEKLKTIVFDKTGTLTRGKPEVTDITSFGMEEKEMIGLAAAAENFSEHPIAKAILDYAKDKEIAVPEGENFRSEAGGGVEVTAGGKAVTAGTRDFVSNSGAVIDEKTEETLAAYESAGKTTVTVAADGKIVGVLAISDVLKDSAGKAVSEIKAMDLSVSMITGDNAITALSVAKEAGIDDVHANVLPGEKAAQVKKIREESGMTAFVGDGINDAPALAEADVGIAVGSGTDIALESADIVLMKSDLRDVAAAIQLSRKVMGRIKLNLFWAFAYNTALIPVAAGVLYPFYGIIFRPEYAGAAMVLSSVTVISLSLMLKGYRPPAVAER